MAAMMRVDYAFVAEAADAQNGLFYVTRGGAEIYALPREFPKPLNLGALSFVVRLSGDLEDLDKPCAVRFTIVDADGHQLAFEQQAETRFERHPIDPTRATSSVMAFRFYGFPVPDFGAYVFEVHAGGERLAEVPFWVVPADSQPVEQESTEEDRPGSGYL
jgi:hypothetical protein